MFSLGGSSDGNKSKTGLGLFGKSFMEEGKTEPEIPVPLKEEIASEQVDTKDLSKDKTDQLAEAMGSTPCGPLSTPSVKLEQDSILDLNKNTPENSVTQKDSYYQ